MELRETILKTATGLYQEKGLKFTMNDVAQRLHIAKKTIYKVYETKEELLMDLVETGFRRIYETKKEIIDSDLRMEDKLAKVLIAMPEDLKTIDFRGLAGMHDKYPEVSERINYYLLSNWEPIFELIDEGVRQGTFNPVNTQVLKQMVTASIDHFLYSDELKEHDISYQQARDAMVEIIMKGIAHEKNQ